MKLLSLKIGTPFRSLPAGFMIKFQDERCVEEQASFRPFCFVGLNGCGKSNVLEALSHIFYHLELCVGVHIPKGMDGRDVFKREECVIDDYYLEYLHYNSGNFGGDDYDKANIIKISILKKTGREPCMYTTKLFVNDKARIPVSLKPSLANVRPADGIRFLPKYIVAYSSGENETLSIPYLKSRLLHLHEFREATYMDFKNYLSPENGMIYIDSNMSQAILLCCLLFEDDSTLSCLREYNYTGIADIKSFRICLRNQNFTYGNGARNVEYSYFKLLVSTLFSKLDSCCTLTWKDDINNVKYFDFFVNDATKKAFKHHFHTGMQCFQSLRLLYELNYYSIDALKADEVLGSKGIYAEGKISLPAPENDIFHFLDFYITKKISKDGETKNILLQDFSDGEHQFIHTMAICLLLKDSDSLILLDEPETHFNPSWRSNFVSVLNESLRKGSSYMGHDIRYDNFLKEVLITSHSPFIISDCLPKHVIIMKKDKEGKTIALNAVEEKIQTYGTSVGILTAEIFGQEDSIGMRAYQEMKEIGKKKDKPEAIRIINAHFGESLEKLSIISQLKK